MAAFATAALVVPLTTVGAVGAVADPVDDGLEAYTVQADRRTANELRRDQYDITRLEQADRNVVNLEIIMTPGEADELRARGLSVLLNPSDDGTDSEDGVFRPWSGPGNLEEEVRTLAAAYPNISELHVIGESVQGQEILALQVTKNPRQGVEGRKPTVVYASAQHAREWITPEVNRRLLLTFLEGYGNDDELTELVDTRELWFVLVANPDGYDYTFTPGNRLWRKNLADNNGDGQISNVDGVDPNRNWPWRWGYDNEGSDESPFGQTYRGPSPASEPETQAMDNLVAMLTPEFFVNYHSAAELILYGVGSQVATPTPDDVILATLAGDDENPAVEGFDPDLSAELYTTNGETTEHLSATYGTLAFTPELTTCQNSAPNPGSCQSGFNYPDDEDLIQEEFERNLAFALDVAHSADDPFEPESHLGNTAPDYVLDTFDVAHSGTTPVAATVSRQIRNPQLRWSINGGRTKVARTTEWDGGERYGERFDAYYREVRGVVTGAQPGDTVEVWFTGAAAGSGSSESERMTFDVAVEAADVLVIANEDYTGVSPVQPGVTAPQYASYYTDSLTANGYTSDVWDIDQSGAPHPVGVLSHYDAVVWYSGDNRITADPDDINILGNLPDLGVDQVMQTLTVSLRDYLNEGGKLIETGRYAGYFGPFVNQTGGLFYGDNGAPDEPCSVEGSIFDDCLILSDDFHQYWMGAFSRSDAGLQSAVRGTVGPLAGLQVGLGGGDGADNQPSVGSTAVTSDVLPVDEFPLFASEASAVYTTATKGPFDAASGEFAVGVVATNNAWNRLTRTVDLTGVSAADTPTLSFATSYDVEGAYDFFGVEARTAGGDDWTMLPDTNGNTVQGPLFVCTDGLWDIHPFVFEHYVDGTCAPSGPTGDFHAFNGNSGGYVDVAFDLSPYAGQVVEVSLAYISDVGVTNTGAIVDDVEVSIGGVVVESEDFESGIGAWSATAPPAGSPAATTEWVRTDQLLPEPAAAVSTADTLYLPFGFEGISTQAERDAFLGAALDGLFD